MNSNKEIFNLDVKLSEEFKELFRDTCNGINEKIIFNDFTAVYTTSGNASQKVYIPNQWFLLGANMAKNGESLIEGMNILKEKVYSGATGDKSNFKKDTNITDKAKVIESIKSKRNYQILTVDEKAKVDNLLEKYQKYGKQLWHSTAVTNLIAAPYKLVTASAGTLTDTFVMRFHQNPSLKNAALDILDSLKLANDFTHLGLKSKFKNWLLEVRDTKKDYITHIEGAHKKWNAENNHEPIANLFSDPTPLYDSIFTEKIKSFFSKKGEEYRKEQEKRASYQEDISRAISYFCEFLFQLENEKIIGINKIYYGAPGTGKSYYVEKNYPNFRRITFHPEYTYFDFVGGLKPMSTNGIISYEFSPGPFTNALVDAIKNPTKSIGLIVEEINRANTAAVFGDIFQLLDRDEKGVSCYKITNPELCFYLNQQFQIENYEKYLSYLKYGNGIETTYHRDANYQLYIPANFSIIATMNSSDQGVFVMDAAFKRRWEFEYLPIDFNVPDLSDVRIAGFNLLWKDFATILNDYLTDENIVIEEDKLIGQRFISKKDLSNEKTVASKLLIYLWDDVVRYNRDLIFSESTRFSKLIEMYNKNPLSIFVEKLRIKLETLHSEKRNNDEIDAISANSINNTQESSNE